MSSAWEDLVARAHGLATHLLGLARLTEFARLRDLGHLATALDEAYGPAVGLTRGATAEQIEVGVRRAAARHLRVLARWSGKRADYLAPLFLDEDRRSVRAMLRGAVAGSPPSERLAGLVPTPGLPERALEELARQPSARSVTALLLAWGHPFGSPLLEESRRSQPDLLLLDLLVNTEFAVCAAESVRRAPRGNAIRRDLVAFVHETIDLENASTAMQLATQRSNTDPARLFLPKGRWLDRATFLAAAATGDSITARAVLSRAFRGTPLARVAATATPARTFEETALSVQLRRTIEAARRSPLGAAAAIALLLRVRAEVRDLRYIIWRIALGAPPAAPGALVSLT